jgi:hypothetical protein
MLDVCYAQGAVTSDPDILCRRCACTRAELDARWTAIQRHFQVDKHDRNKLVNKHANIIRREYFAFCRQQSRKGIASGKKRGRKTPMESAISGTEVEPPEEPKMNQEQVQVLELSTSTTPPAPPSKGGSSGGDFSDCVERIRGKHPNPSQFDVGVQYLTEKECSDDPAWRKDFERIHTLWCEYWRESSNGRRVTYCGAPKFGDFVQNWKSYQKGPETEPKPNTSWAEGLK